MKHWSAIARFSMAAVCFALAYTQAPLFYSNQNQYFLHGLAQAGRGRLADDWLANTADPTPVFTALVAGTARWFDDYLFHIYYVALFGIYVAALWGAWMASRTPAPRPAQQLAFLALLVLVHAALLRWLSCQLFGVDYPWYFQAGLAGQYLLGPMLQPSVMGVVLLLSISLFVHDRPYWAAATASLAGTLHSTYLLPGGVLVLAYAIELARTGRRRDAVWSGLLALLLVMPVLVYVLTAFGPTTPEEAEQARHIMVHFRVPHHAEVERWFDPIAGLQIAWMLLGVTLAWRTRLGAVMLIVFSVGTLLTLVQWCTGSDLLALLFPWRLSVLLVPLSTALVLGRLAERIPDRAAWVAGPLVLSVCVVGGVIIMERGLGYLRNQEEEPVYAFVRANLAPGQVYLVPYRPPAQPGPRGSRSNDFLLEDDRSGKRIPLEMQRFRLHAGAPILVDFKAIPYKDVDVLEWRRRLEAGLQIYRDLEAGRLAEARRALAAEGVTHVVLLRGQAAALEQLQAVYEDEHYVIYRVAGEKEAFGGPAEAAAAKKCWIFRVFLWAVY